MEGFQKLAIARGGGRGSGRMLVPVYLHLSEEETLAWRVTLYLDKTDLMALNGHNLRGFYGFIKCVVNGAFTFI